MKMLLSLPQYLRVNYFMVEAHCFSAKQQRGLFHGTESSQTFFKHGISDFPDKLLFVSFRQNKPISLFSNAVYEHALHSALQQKTQKIDRSKYSQNLKNIVKILRF